MSNIEYIKSLICQESLRQMGSISLIASENHCSADVMEAQGSGLTNKYAEGYPGHRYYHGCEVVDQIEQEAIEAAKKLFGCSYANVQPHSGSQANFAIFSAFLKPGDSILGMGLNYGGHLTHGFNHNISGKLYKSHFYNTNSDGIIDMSEVAEVAKKCKPKLIIAGASSYSRQINWTEFRRIADESGAFLLADIAHYAGLIAAGEYPSPVGLADFTTSTTHKVLRGPRGGLIMWNKQEYTKIINSSVFPGTQGGPLMHVIAGKAICFLEAMTEDYKNYGRSVIENARAMARKFEDLGWDIISSGTDCHMFMLDLRRRMPDLTGAVAADMLAKQGIIVNKQLLPNDFRPAQVTSGLRIGTPSMTTRGMDKEVATHIAQYIHEILLGKNVKNQIKEICNRYPIP